MKQSEFGKQSTIQHIINQMILWTTMWHNLLEHFKKYFKVWNIKCSQKSIKHICTLQQITIEWAEVEPLPRSRNATLPGTWLPDLCSFSQITAPSASWTDLILTIHIVILVNVIKLKLCPFLKTLYNLEETQLYWCPLVCFGCSFSSLTPLHAAGLFCFTALKYSTISTFYCWWGCGLLPLWASYKQHCSEKSLTCILAIEYVNLNLPHFVNTFYQFTH